MTFDANGDAARIDVQTTDGSGTKTYGKFDADATLDAPVIKDFGGKCMVGARFAFKPDTSRRLLAADATA